LHFQGVEIPHFVQDDKKKGFEMTSIILWPGNILHRQRIRGFAERPPMPQKRKTAA
jgi:hypothetical protein